SRHEDRENDMKKEYQTLSLRHTEMMKMYMDHIEKTKLAGQTDIVGSPRLFKLNIQHPHRPISPIHDIQSDITGPTKDSNLIESYAEMTSLHDNEDKSNNDSLLQEMTIPAAIKANLDSNLDKDTGSKSIETQATVATSSAATVTTPSQDFSAVSTEAADIVSSTPELYGATSPESNETVQPRR
ncbi:uncharacterized protein LOC102809110, partial [Saccoglossus kowalevskii]|uniref:C-Jun-amino-terminal kinase-interacting protein 4-like n=1 Tax=Saccoglossus kowalevskii TaxID=10224 RepID=A0ABM0LX29_SACKO